MTTRQHSGNITPMSDFDRDRLPHVGVPLTSPEEEPEVFVEQMLDDHWFVRFDLAEQDGRPVVTGVHVLAFGQRVPLGGLNANVLRRIRLGAVDEALREWREDRRSPKGWDMPGWSSGALKELEEETEPLFAALDPWLTNPRRPGRHGRADEDYARLAAAYVDLIDRGSRTPIRDLAEELRARGGDWLSDESLRQLIHTARSRGLLSPSPPGKAGGALTPAAIELLGSIDAPAKRQRRPAPSKKTQGRKKR